MKNHDTESPVRYSHPHYGTVYTDGSFETTDGKHRTFGAMAGWRNRYRAADKMHQPLTLSFWSDVCNGKKANWPLPTPLPNDLGHWAGMLGDLTSRAKGERS
jgi:hypothetical protein